MRNATLHRRLEAFAVDAAAALGARIGAGHEVPFELAEEPGNGGDGEVGGTPLYCYRPLVGPFIRDARGELAELVSSEAATTVLAECDALDVYLADHGEPRVPAERRAAAELALEVFLREMYTGRSQFGFEPALFESSYATLERTLYDGRAAGLVIAPVLGVGLDAATTELTVGDGLSLLCGEALAGAPREAVWGAGEDASVLAVFTPGLGAGERSVVPVARARFRRLLSALRLLSPGTFALGPTAWAQTPSGNWRPVALGAAGRIGGRLGGGRAPLTIVPATREEELRAFVRLVSRPGTGGELTWALGRFEMGCERAARREALTDHLLALRALLEPEGPASGRLAGRLAAICAQPEGRATLAARAARAIALERAVITGMAESGEVRGERVDAVVEELAGHLRAILRDAVCGHLDLDLCAVADALLAEAAADLDEPPRSPTRSPGVGFESWTAPHSVPTGAGSVLPARLDT